MNILILFTLIFFSNILEAIHDSTIEEIQRPIKEKIRKWHKLDFAYHIVLGTAIAVMMSDKILIQIALLIQIGLFRAFFFNISKNMIQKKPIFYLGKNGIDGFFRKKPGLYYFAILMAIVANFIYLL